jgi:hypothetical protein
MRILSFAKANPPDPAPFLCGRKGEDIPTSFSVWGWPRPSRRKDGLLLITVLLYCMWWNVMNKIIFNVKN